MRFRNTLILSALLAVAGANASMNFTGVLLSENFDALPSAGNTALTATIGVHNVMTGTGWVGTKVAGTGTTLNLSADNGTLNSGALYSYGATGTAERALGVLASASNICAFGVEIINGSGSAINSVTISYRREMWRSSTSSTGTPNTLAFAYATTGGTATSANFLSDAGVTANTALDAVGDPPVAANGAVDGNAGAILVSNTFAVSVNAGDSLFIRWTDVNDQGNDAGLAVDNFEFNATVVPEPSTIVAIAAALGLLVARRRR